MKLTLSRNTAFRFPIGFSHHGAHIKRKYGGPPWWRYINGFWLRWPGRLLLWVELWKPHRRGPFFKNAVRPRPGQHHHHVVDGKCVFKDCQYRSAT